MIAAVAIAALLICPAAADSTSSALNCLTLYPTPDLPAVAGSIALLPAHSPFGVAVTEDGRPRYHLVATVGGLPDPRSLGRYTTYVAWAYTLSLDSARNLGPVHNGRVDLGELRYTQFRILISAERSATGRERQGRLVLRGTSPSARLLAHRDLLQPSAVGVVAVGGGRSAMADGPDSRRTRAGAMRDGKSAMGGGHDMGGMGSLGKMSSWPMPPMPPRMPMMPSMMGLVPTTAPYLPPCCHPEERSDTGSTIAMHDHRLDRRSLAVLGMTDTITLEASVISRTIAGHTFSMYGFRGGSPGPVVEVRQGSTLTVRFHNALDVPTSVHWHGIRLDNRSDGAVGVTQDAVPPGTWFTYTVHVPDAGIYWYHPHVREDTQQGLGLYGVLLVRPLSADEHRVNREQILTLDDMLLGPGGPTPFGADAATHALMGRFGNAFLVNGDTGYSLTVRRGEVVRFYLVNVSNSRIYNLSFGGAPMKVVAGGGGRFEREERVSSVVIAPAERYVVDVEFPRPGTFALVNRVQAVDHLFGAYFPEVDTLGAVRVSIKPVSRSHAGGFTVLHQPADVERELAPFRKYFAKPVDRLLVLTMRTHDLPPAISNMLLGINAAVDWNDGMPMMNWVTTSHEVQWVLRDPATGRENMDIDWHFHRGDVVKLRIFNDPSTSHAMAHPIHLHGQRFLVLSRDGVANDNLVWKDTAIIPAGETVDLLVDMSNPGRWMLHCHIAEHLESGMMTAITVE